MPDAEAVAVAKAVVTQIEDAGLTPTFLLERSYADWHLLLEEANTLRVDVALVTTGQQVEAQTRGGSLSYIVPVDVAIRKRFDGQTLVKGRPPIADVDSLMYLTQQIHELFTVRRLTDYLSASWHEDPRILVAPLVSALRDKKQFTSVVRLSFSAEKQSA